MESILNIAVRAARKAGHSVRGQARNVPPLTVGSIAANEYVRRLTASTFRTIASDVRKSFPEHAIVEASVNLRELKNDTVWIVDPLNGWQNFQRRIDHHCTLIGIRVDRIMKHALIVDHMRDEEFYASAGAGARIGNNRIRISNANSLKTALVALDDQSGRIATALPDFEVRIRQSGCFGLDLAYLSSGRFDAYAAEKANRFDSDVSRLFLLEAGGFSSALNGGEWLEPIDGLVAANPQLHRRLVSLLRKREGSKQDQATVEA